MLQITLSQIGVLFRLLSIGRTVEGKLTANMITTAAFGLVKVVQLTVSSKLTANPKAVTAVRRKIVAMALSLVEWVGFEQ